MVAQPLGRGPAPGAGGTPQQGSERGGSGARWAVRGLSMAGTRVLGLSPREGSDGHLLCDPSCSELSLSLSPVSAGYELWVPGLCWGRSGLPHSQNHRIIEVGTDL